MSSTEMLAIIFDTSQHDHYYRFDRRSRRMQGFLRKTPQGFVPSVSRISPARSVAPHHEKVFQVAGELGLRSDWRVVVDGEDYSLGDGIVDALSRINIEQELEFSTVALAHYLPPMRSWRNRQGEVISFDQLVEKLLAQKSGACYNTHRLYALVILLRANQKYAILEGEIAKQIEAELKRASLVLTRQQMLSGLWEGSLFDDRLKEPASLAHGEFLRATGHHLEWIAFAPKELRPTDAVIQKAATGLVELIERSRQEVLDMQYGPLTHAVRALLLLSGRGSVEAVLDGLPAERGDKGLWMLPAGVPPGLPR